MAETPAGRLTLIWINAGAVQRALPWAHRPGAENVVGAWLRTVVFVGVLGLGAGCHSQPDPELSASVAAHDAALREMPRDFYRPGLGDLMHSLQLRHAKLWFAGAAGNWELAAFESHELHENFERVARWHADNEDIPMAPALKAYMQSSHYALDQSIANRAPASFETAFDRFTDGCNQCHRAAKHPFIVIRRPIADPVGNQAWQWGAGDAG